MIKELWSVPLYIIIVLILSGMRSLGHGGVFFDCRVLFQHLCRSSTFLVLQSP